MPELLKSIRNKDIPSLISCNDGARSSAWLERFSDKEEVGSSNLPGPINNAGMKSHTIYGYIMNWHFATPSARTRGYRFFAGMDSVTGKKANPNISCRTHPYGNALSLQQQLSPLVQKHLQSSLSCLSSHHLSVKGLYR